MGKPQLFLRAVVCACTAALGIVAASACGGDGSSASPAAGGQGDGAVSGWTFVPPGSDAGGSLATGGATGGGGTAGKTGAAGAGGKPAGGSASSGGSSAITSRPYACGGQVPNQPVITHFDAFTKGSWASPGNLEGGIYIYPDPLMVKDGEFLRFKDQVATWTGIGVWFSGCINASKFAGVKFTIYGSVPAERQVWMYAISNRNRDIDDDNSVGACAPADPQDAWATCHPPGLVLSVSAEPTTQYLPWSAFKDGMPSENTDGSDLLALQWSFDWNDSLSPYAAELTIDDLEFVAPGSEPTGGGGGSGGSTGGGSASAGSTSGGTAPVNEGGVGGI